MEHRESLEEAEEAAEHVRTNLTAPEGKNSKVLT